jgi:predicted RNA-binding protein associated with RNAse of E/G family
VSVPDPADDHRLDRWYVNFQRRLRRTAIGFDTFDLLVDLVVAPDRSSWVWKDEDEYAQARRLGVVSETDHAVVEAAREQALEMITRSEGPFVPEAGWTRWHPDPSWPTPVLPPAAALP